jgi:hypothetical protein
MCEVLDLRIVERLWKDARKTALREQGEKEESYVSLTARCEVSS